MPVRRQSCSVLSGRHAAGLLLQVPTHGGPASGLRPAGLGPRAGGQRPPGGQQSDSFTSGTLRGQSRCRLCWKSSSSHCSSYACPTGPGGPGGTGSERPGRPAAQRPQEFHCAVPESCFRVLFQVQVPTGRAACISSLPYPGSDWQEQQLCAYMSHTHHACNEYIHGLLRPNYV